MTEGNAQRMTSSSEMRRKGSTEPKTVRILGWRATGLRCPDHTINCCDHNGKPHRVTLIQMPNGTGKTTTLALIRSALSGSAERLSPEEVLEYQKRSSSEPTGSFELVLVYNTKRVTVTMEFDFEQGEVSYGTTYGIGRKIGFHPPLGLKQFMNKNFVDFYVFDGELADRLMDRGQTHAEQAIEALFQVQILARMKSKVIKYWEDITRDRTAKDKRGYSRRRNNLERWKARLETVQAEKSQLDTELHRYEVELTFQLTKYEEGINKETERTTRIQNAQSSVDEAQRKVEGISRVALDNMRDPHALSASIGNRILAFKSGLDRVKLPESAAREFFEELCQESECICGRPIDDQVRVLIRERSRRYLGSDDVSILNELKSTIVDAVGTSRSASVDALTDQLARLSKHVRERIDAENTLHELQRAAESEDPDLKRAKQNSDQLRQKISEVKDRLKRYDSKDNSVRLDKLERVDVDKVLSIPTLEEGVERLEVRVAEALDTLTTLQKQKILGKILESAHRTANRAIADEIRDETNEVITELMPHNEIRIESIDGCLNLLGQRRGSVGETLSVGYAFLSTLFHRSQYHELPFVVDSPANPIDLAVRDTIGQLVPKLSEQFIAFMISSERDRFVDGIKRTTRADIQFETVFRKGATELEVLASGFSTCVESRDGLRVPGETFFRRFQLEEQE